MAEERGIQLHGSFDIDEETRFSSVQRGTAFDDSGYEEEEDILLDSRNTETFGGPYGSVSERPIDLIGSKINDTTQVSSSLSVVDEAQSSLTSVVNTYCTGSSDHARFLRSEHHWESSIQEKNVLDDEQGTNGDVKVSAEKQVNTDDALLLISESLQSQSGNIDCSGGITVPADATVQLPPRALSKGNEKTFSIEGPGPVKLSGEKPAVNSHGRPGSFRSLSSGHGLSPSSSVGSLSSEKSSLNPYAKEFKLNPNEKSFTPTQTVFPPLLRGRPPPPDSLKEGAYQALSPPPMAQGPKKY